MHEAYHDLSDIYNDIHYNAKDTMINTMIDMAKQNCTIQAQL